MNITKFTNALVIMNGDLSDTSQAIDLADGSTFIIAADGGANLALKLNVQPHMIIGDFDSVTESSLSELQKADDSIQIEKYSTDKDQTDSELALNYLIGKGIKRVVITGFQGARIDHMLGNLFLLRKFYADFDELRIIEGNQEIYVISGRAKIIGSKGDTISFMPIAGSVNVSASSGLVYDLSKYSISQTENPGISNVMIDSVATVDIESGMLLVVRTNTEVA
jgi:thiamine pyrophosphokinase